MSLPKPYYDDGKGIQIYNGDCREILPSLPPVDLVLTDPPYGMNNNPDSSRFSGGSSESKDRRGIGGRHKEPIVGDDQPFNPSAFIEFEKVILWGSNHFSRHLPVGTTLVWIKRLDGAFGSFLSDAEVAWMKGGCGVYCFRDTSLMSEARDRVHPNQKPLSLIHWCIEKSKVATGTILDPFMGSGTALRAAKDLGRKAIGIEIEEKYCEIAAKRLSQEVFNFEGAA